MEDSATRSELIAELRKLLLEAAQESGGARTQVADQIAMRVAAELRNEFASLRPATRPEATLSSHDREMLAQRMAEVMENVLRNSPAPLPLADSGQAGEDGAPEKTGHKWRKATKDANGGVAQVSFWENAKAVALAAAAAALVFSLVAAWLLAMSFARMGSASVADPEVTASEQVSAVTAEEEWAALARDFPFGANMSREIACGDNPDDCEDWDIVRKNLIASGSPAYLERFGEVLRERTGCNQRLPDIVEGADKGAFFDKVDACLESSAARKS